MHLYNIKENRLLYDKSNPTKFRQHRASIAQAKTLPGTTIIPQDKSNLNPDTKTLYQSAYNDTARKNIEDNFGYSVEELTDNIKADIENILIDNNIDKEDFEAVLSLDENGNQKTWLLTGFDITKKEADAKDEVSTQSDATQVKPTFSRQDLGAALNTINNESVSNKHLSQKGSALDTDILSIAEIKDIFKSKNNKTKNQTVIVRTNELGEVVETTYPTKRDSNFFNNLKRGITVYDVKNGRRKGDNNIAPVNNIITVSTGNLNPNTKTLFQSTYNDTTRKNIEDNFGYSVEELTDNIKADNRGN